MRDTYDKRPQPSKSEIRKKAKEEAIQFLNELFDEIDTTAENTENYSNIEDVIEDIREYTDNVNSVFENIEFNDNQESIHDTLSGIISRIDTYAQNVVFNEYEMTAEDFGCERYHSDKHGD